LHVTALAVQLGNGDVLGAFKTAGTIRSSIASLRRASKYYRAVCLKRSGHNEDEYA